MNLVDRFAEQKLSRRVRRCAGLSAVVLQCHRDTWTYVLRVMSGPWIEKNRWDTDPSDSITEQPGEETMIRVRLSGARLAELLTTLWYLPARRRWWLSDAPKGMRAGHDFGNRATAAEEQQARRLYDAIAPVIDRVEQNTPRQGEIPTVVIDDAVAGSR